MLRTRVITGVTSLAILIAVLFVLPAFIAKQVIAVLILAGAWEWSGFLGLTANTARVAYVVIIAALMAAMVFVVPEQTVLLLQVACIWWFVALIWPGARCED